jgi:hypothetical protein
VDLWQRPITNSRDDTYQVSVELAKSKSRDSGENAFGIHRSGKASLRGASEVSRAACFSFD